MIVLCSVICINGDDNKQFHFLQKHLYFFQNFGLKRRKTVEYLLYLKSLKREKSVRLIMIVLCSVICINGVNISTSSDKCHMIDNRPSSWRPRLPLVCPNELQPKGYKTSSCELITLFESYNFSERAYREQTLYAGRTGECIFTVCQYCLLYTSPSPRDLP